MRIIFLSILFIVLLSVATTSILYTSRPVVEENPCRLVSCTTPIFGFWETKAEQVGTTADGYAVCHCPHEPADQLYYISYTRKY